VARPTGQGVVPALAVCDAGDGRLVREGVVPAGAVEGDAAQPAGNDVRQERPDHGATPAEDDDPVVEGREAAAGVQLHPDRVGGGRPLNVQDATGDAGGDAA